MIDFDPNDDPQQYGDKPLNLPDSFVVWDRKMEQFTDPMDFQLRRGRTALTILAMIRGFARSDLWLIADTAGRSIDWATGVTHKLEDETGIRFRLTGRQWQVLATELFNAGGV